jgi:hypothetical protein
MDRLVGELRSSKFAAAHPVLQAAYAHYAFVAIHPFADGNGRVSRALASAYLYRRPGVPLVIFAYQKDDYIDALEAADAGVPDDFIRFVADRVEDVIGIVEVSRAEPGTPAAATSLASLRQALIESGGLSRSEQELIARRITEAAGAEIDRQVRDLSLPTGLDIQIVARHSAFGMHTLVLTGRAGRIASATELGATMREHAARGPAFELSIFPGPLRTSPVSVGLRDVFPTLTKVFSIKLRLWAESLIADVLAELDRELRSQVR